MSHSRSFVVDVRRGFEEYGFDERLLQAIRLLKWTHPTIVQATCFPLAMNGKDILARSSTGTGKTAAYALPVVQSLLRDRVTGSMPHINSVVLVPTRDLCIQVRDCFDSLLVFLRKAMKCVALLPDSTVDRREITQTMKPDILVTTPSVLFSLVDTNAVDLSRLRSLVIDEADLILSEGLDLGSIRSYIPIAAQVYMFSATLSADVLELKKRLLNSPCVVKLCEDRNQDFQVNQYYIKCLQKQKYLFLYGLLRTEEITGKCLIFVNSVNEAFRLQIFLDTFKITAAVLNSEVPENARIHIVKQFNDGIITHLIATDESLQLDDLSRRKSDSAVKSITNQTTAATGLSVDLLSLEENGKGSNNKRKRGSCEEIVASRDEDEPPAWKKRKLTVRLAQLRRKEALAAEYSAHRGVDFKHVAWVINFEPTQDPTTYTHRIGRTGRGGSVGNALTFLHLTDHDKLLEVLKDDQLELQEYEMKQHYGKLEVRVDDILEKISAKAIKHARVRDLAKEILTSEKLKAHFQTDPTDLRSLQHMATMKPKGIQHTAHYIFDVPEYLGLNVRSEAVKLQEANRINGESVSCAKREVARSAGKLMTQRADPLSGFNLENAKKIERKVLTQMDLKLLDPAGLKRKRQQESKRRKVKEWLKKFGKKKNGRHSSKGNRPFGSFRPGKGA